MRFVGMAFFATVLGAALGDLGVTLVTWRFWLMAVCVIGIVSLFDWR